LWPDAEYENPVLYWCEEITSFITDCDVLDCVEEPDLNWGTTGVARVLRGNTNINNSQSLVNFYANGSRGDATCTTSPANTSCNSRR